MGGLGSYTRRYFFTYLTISIDDRRSRGAARRRAAAGASEAADRTGPRAADERGAAGLAARV